MSDLIEIIKCDCGRHIAIPNEKEIRAEERKKTIDECINTIVSTTSEVALREPFNEHIFTVIADRQHEIIKLLEQLKEQKNERH